MSKRPEITILPPGYPADATDLHGNLVNSDRRIIKAVPLDPDCSSRGSMALYRHSGRLTIELVKSERHSHPVTPQY